MILDKDGNEIPQSPEPHRFGQFVIPKDCHIKGLAGIGETGHPQRRAWGHWDEREEKED